MGRMAFALFLVFLAGCIEMMPFIGPMISIGVMWAEGEAKKYYYNDAPTILWALDDVLNDMEFPINKEEVWSDGTHYFEVGGGDDPTFKIKVIPERKNVTKLCIRVNIMGDRPYAELIYREVDKRQGVRVFKTVRQLERALQ